MNPLWNLSYLLLFQDYCQHVANTQHRCTHAACVVTLSAVEAHCCISEASLVASDGEIHVRQESILVDIWLQLSSWALYVDQLFVCSRQRPSHSVCFWYARCQQPPKEFLSLRHHVYSAVQWLLKPLTWSWFLPSLPPCLHCVLSCHMVSRQIAVTMYLIFGYANLWLR